MELTIENNYRGGSTLTFMIHNSTMNIFNSFQKLLRNLGRSFQLEFFVIIVVFRDDLINYRTN